MDEGTRAADALAKHEAAADRPGGGTEVPPDSEAFGHDIDSVTASRAASILFLASIVVGIVCGFATWLFVAASHYGIELLWHALPEAFPGIPRPSCRSPSSAQ